MEQDYLNTPHQQAFSNNNKNVVVIVEDTSVFGKDNSGLTAMQRTDLDVDNFFIHDVSEFRQPTRNNEEISHPGRLSRNSKARNPHKSKVTTAAADMTLDNDTFASSNNLYYHEDSAIALTSSSQDVFFDAGWSYPAEDRSSLMNLDDINMHNAQHDLSAQEEVNNFEDPLLHKIQTDLEHSDAINNTSVWTKDQYFHQNPYPMHYDSWSSHPQIPNQMNRESPNQAHCSEFQNHMHHGLSSQMHPELPIQMNRELPNQMTQQQYLHMPLGQHHELQLQEQQQQNCWYRDMQESQTRYPLEASLQTSKRPAAPAHRFKSIRKPRSQGAASKRASESSSSSSTKCVSVADLIREHEQLRRHIEMNNESRSREDMESSKMIETLELLKSQRNL